MVLHRHIILILIFFSNISLGFSQTANIIEGCVPLEVDFEAPAGSSTFYWDFKDGASSVLQNPSNLFINPGIYDVDFRQTVNGPIIGTITINVYPTPSPTISTDSPRVACQTLDIDFTVNSNAPAAVNIIDYDWTFGDGYSDNGQIVNHVYNTGGFFDVGVELISSTPNCNVTLLVDSFILVSRITGSMFVNPFTACDTPVNVNFFTNAMAVPFPLISYDWDFGDGTSSTSPGPPSKFYSTPGVTPISLTVSDSIGCSRTFNRDLTITPFSIDSFIMPDTICIGAEFNVINTVENYITLDWTFTGSPIFSPPSLLYVDSVELKYDVIGTYDVTLTINKDGCTKSLTRQIIVVDPVLNFTILPDTVCSRTFTLDLEIDSSILESVQWYFGDSILLSEKFKDNVSYTPVWDTITWNADESMIVMGLTKYGCLRIDTFPFYYPAIAHLVPSSVYGLAPLTVDFYDASHSFYDIVDWQLSYGDGTAVSLSSFDNTIPHTYTLPGVYEACLIVQNLVGCSDTMCIEIVVGSRGTASCGLGTPGYLCVNEDLTINYSTGDPNQLLKIWADDLTAYACPGQGSMTFQFNHAAGLQNIEMEVSSYGSVFLDTVFSIYVSGAIADFSFTQYCDSIFKVDFHDASENATHVNYTFGDGTSSNLPNPTHYYDSAGTYQVVQFAYNDTSSCAIDTFVRTVKIYDPVASFTYEQGCFGNLIEMDGSASIGVDTNGCKRNFIWINDGIPFQSETGFTNLSVDTGFREISLIVKNPIGCRDTVTQTVHIETMSLDFEIIDTFICLPEEVIFDANLEGPNPITFQQWSFGDGNAASMDSLVHIYSTPPASDSEYVAYFQAIDSKNCYIADTAIVRLFEPQFTIATIPFTGGVCLGDSIQFTAVGNQYADLLWDFGNGETSVNSAVKILYDSLGTYEVMLIYSDTGNIACIDTIFKTITVQMVPDLTVISSADDDSAFCFPLNIELEAIDSNNINGNYLWSINGTSFIINPVSLTFDRGINEVQVIKTTSVGCADTATRVFNVVGPEADFIIDTNNICKGEEITFTITDSIEVASYVWDFGDGTTENDVSPTTHQYDFVPPNGQTKAKLSVFGAGGVCPYSLEKDIFLHEVYADFLRNLGDTAICLAPYFFDNLSAGADNFEWHLGDGTTLFDENIGMYEYLAPGEYDVSLYIENNQFGCIDSITKTVILHPIPDIAAIGDTICEFDTATVFIINPDPNVTYTWQPLGFLDQDTGAVNQGVFSLTQTLQALAVDSNGCTDSTSTEVVVINESNIPGLDTIIIQGDSVVLPLVQQMGYQYSWSPETGLSCIDCDNPVVQVFELSTYQLTYIDMFLGCFEGLALYTIDVYPETFIKLPNTFTPNGDGNNDIIYAEGWGIDELVYYRIYNRWGELVFETDDESIGWDGYHKGELQNDDIYQFKVKGFDFIGRELEAEGFIHLMH